MPLEQAIVTALFLSIPLGFVILASFHIAAWLDHQRRMRKAFSASEKYAGNPPQPKDALARARRYLRCGLLTVAATWLVGTCAAATVSPASAVAVLVLSQLSTAIAMTAVSCLVLNSDDQEFRLPQQLQFRVADLRATLVGLAVGFGVAHLILDLTRGK